MQGLTSHAKDFDLPPKTNGRPFLISRYHDQICLHFEENMSAAVQRRDERTVQAEGRRLVRRLTRPRQSR